jgi:hypothetical protein
LADILLLQIKDFITSRPAQIRHDSNVHRVAELAAYTGRLETEVLRFMSELKHALREGLKVFEELEGETIKQIGQRFVDTARAAPKVSEGFYARVDTGIQETESSRS